MAEEEKVTYKERLAALRASVDRGMRKVFRGEHFQQYLITMSRFHRYSVNNTILIYLQRPDAVQLKDYDRWKARNRFVRRGQQGVQLIMPSQYTRRMEQTKLDPRTQTPVMDENGDVVREETDVSLRGYRIASLFDISQTVGDGLEEHGLDSVLDAEHYELFAEALQKASPAQVIHTPENLYGMIQEIAGAVNANQTRKAQPDKDAVTMALESKAITFAVGQHYGVALPEQSFPEVEAWADGKRPEQLRQTLSTIGRTTSRMIYFIDRAYEELRQERGIDAPGVEQAVVKPEVKQDSDTPQLGFVRYLTDPEESCFAIYQLKMIPENAGILQVDYSLMERWGEQVLFENYELAHEGELPEFGTTERKVNDIRREFVQSIPGRNCGLRTSDVVVLNEYGKTTCCYLNQSGYTALKGFLPQQRAALEEKRQAVSEQLSMDGTGEQRGSILSRLDSYRTVESHDRVRADRSAR